MSMVAQLAIFGEVSEWPIELAWKACIPQGIEGSNPSLSANEYANASN